MAACAPTSTASSASSPSPAPSPTPAPRSTVAIRIGPVRLDPGPHADLKIGPVAARPEPTRTPEIKHAAASPVAHATTYAYGAPHARPQILAINLSTVDITSGDTVSGTVETTSNVASVEARISGWSMSVPRTRIGHFEASGQLPDIPFFLKGSYTLQLIARNADGVQAERDIPITVR